MQNLILKKIDANKTSLESKMYELQNIAFAKFILKHSKKGGKQ